MKKIINIWKISSNRDKKKFSLMIIVYLFSSISDLLGVASIYPFLSVLSNSNLIYQNKYLILLNSYLNFDTKEFIILLGVITLLVLIFNQAIRIFAAWFSSFFFKKYSYNLSQQIYSYFLRKKYEDHLSENYSNLSQKVIIQIGNVVDGFLSPIVTIITSSFSMLLIIIFLLFYHWSLTLATLVFYSFYYLIVISKVKNNIKNFGKIIPNYFSKASKIVLESFLSIKEIKILNKYSFFEKIFYPIVKNYNLIHVKLILYQNLPHAFLEIFSFAILLFISIFFYDPTNIAYFIPTIGILVLALKRLQPSISNMYSSYAQIKVYHHTFEFMYDDIVKSYNSLILNNNNNKIIIKKIKSISIKNLNFKYKKSKSLILNNINLNIEKGDKIGFFGESGAGKSTLIDSIIGLLDANDKSLFINENNINNCDLNSYLSNIGYAPQDGFIFDSTIAENISLQNLETIISDKQLQKNIENVIDMTCIKDFIHQKLDKSIFSKIGEDGIKLSNGQRQRIILSRALLNKPNLIILDESTNAINEEIEEKIINNIFANFHDSIILMISHNKKILESCNKIFEFKDGNISIVKNL